MISIATRTSHPDWIVERFIDELGRDDALATLALDNEPPAVTLRVNPMRSTPDAVIEELRAAGIDVEPATLVPDALLVRHTGDLGALELVRDGRVTPQDQASQAVVAALDPQPGNACSTSRRRRAARPPARPSACATTARGRGRSASGACAP